jgi:hypothetical protein
MRQDDSFLKAKTLIWNPTLLSKIAIYLINNPYIHTYIHTYIYTIHFLKEKKLNFRIIIQFMISTNKFNEDEARMMDEPYVITDQDGKYEK